MHTLGHLRCFFLRLGDVEVEFYQGGSVPGKDTEDRFGCPYGILTGSSDSQSWFSKKGSEFCHGRCLIIDDSLWEPQFSYLASGDPSLPIMVVTGTTWVTSPSWS